ncbi:hypothetical protein B484DRAFT_453450 [Ochromonadaceae sp. CCMP2298]|nr:hypothetical protein B484DRAFT_453450 [Ochromonadaceae sp. CCMP2298]|mmetsp:Transcript_20232/g.45008  ORF Transcript_20232/g.45008 Transcript_20232/m.45008 type:complete len:262 (+) Transcript_20232:182-967(+)|eukprot:CAMPEP_0173198018 /NCGR_PEP_ID=MMETSP1141-20130122/16468_1 /TAXON_ID=483371 /ORGANISM="non described non described, Strain CCMP2298" /LENGTH=261 /DNA_ID=CAMNT_0014122793 /DNA_START=150 /DNA_END=935 /DNA_ORIENTATION=-
MSWAQSQYDENPFSENNADRNQNISTPLTHNAPKLDTPPWLQDPTASPAVGPKSVSTAKEAGESDDETMRAVPRMILYTRIINLVLSVCMIIVSLLAILTTQSATTGVLACYLVVFSCLLCCFETHLKQVSKIIALNFGFMYSARARSIFMLFIGTILFSFSLFGKIIGVCMLTNAAFNMYILVKYPGFEDIQRNDAQSDIRDFLASNPAFAQQVMTAGVDVIKSNPEFARQGAEAMLSGAQRPASAGNSRINSDANYASV